MYPLKGNGMAAAGRLYLATVDGKLIWPSGVHGK